VHDVHKVPRHYERLRVTIGIFSYLSYENTNVKFIEVEHTNHKQSSLSNIRVGSVIPYFTDAKRAEMWEI
jgi:hypothetical protein